MTALSSRVATGLLVASTLLWAGTSAAQPVARDRPQNGTPQPAAPPSDAKAAATKPAEAANVMTKTTDAAGLQRSGDAAAP